MNSGVRDGYRYFFVLGFAESATARAVVRTVGVCGRCDAMLLGRIAIRPVSEARMCHRRWQTMHNRWWSDSATCGERIPHYHSASKMSNNVVPLRGTLLLMLPLRRLRPCGLASG